MEHYATVSLLSLLHNVLIFHGINEKSDVNIILYADGMSILVSKDLALAMS